MVLPSLNTSAAAAVATAVGNVVVTNPGSPAGKLLVAFCWANNSSAVWTPPAGWTARAANGAIGTAFFTRTADGSEGGTFTFTRDVTTAAAGVILAVVDNPGNYDIGAVVNGGLSSTVSIPSINLAEDNEFLLQFATYLTTTATAWTPPATATERVDTTASGNAIQYAIGDEIVASGATGTRDWVHTGTQQSRAGMVAIKSAAAPAYNNTLAITLDKLIPALSASHSLSPAYNNSLSITLDKLIPALSSTHSLASVASGPLVDKARTNLLGLVGGTGKGLSNIDLFKQSNLYNASLGSSAGTQYWNYLKSLR